jgi:hypothetical protein
MMRDGPPMGRDDKDLHAGGQGCARLDQRTALPLIRTGVELDSIRARGLTNAQSHNCHPSYMSSGYCCALWRV